MNSGHDGLFLCLHIYFNSCFCFSCSSQQLFHVHLHKFTSFGYVVCYGQCTVLHQQLYCLSMSCVVYSVQCFNSLIIIPCICLDVCFI